MVKGRFIVNPFAELSLTEHDHVQLQDLANSVIMAHLDKWSIYKSEKMQVDSSRWKLVKERQNIHMYTERSSASNSGELITGNGLPMILAVGTLQGKLDDLMHGVMSPTLESMRIKASYVDDFDGAAVLDTLVEPSLEDPFQTLVLKWMEVDIPLVKNRDYVYLEGTGHVQTPRGERLGYHVMHSVHFPETHHLPNRVRGNISALAFWQQTGPNTLDMWGTAVMDLGGDMIRMVAVPAMVGAFMSSVKYGFCGQMRKLAWVLEQRYEESRQRGAPNKKSDCVTCYAPISGRKIGDFGKSNGTCKLCFGFVCRACQIVRKLSFVDPDLMLSQQKVTFCSTCMGQVTNLSSTDAARAMLLGKRATRASSTRSRRREALRQGRFVVNPFPTVPLAPSDQRQLHDLAISLVKAGLERYTAFVEKEQRQVDLSRWKLVKSKENTRVFMEKSPSPRSNGNQETQDLPSLLCVGTTAGQLEDLMFGVVNPTLEVMRIKASYVDDLSGAAVLATVEEPTLDEPFKSLVVKWMELDIPLHSTSLVKNRDYIYAEATDILTLPNGDRVGYHLLHSINFPQTHELPNRIRGNLSICGFFRQINEGTTEIYVTGIMDPAGGLVRHLVITNMANTFLSTLKYAHCGQMKKLAWMLEKRYKESRLLGKPNKRAQCVTCRHSITGRKLGDFGKTDATCKLCFGFVCHSCKIHKKISFITPDLLLAKRNVTFCGLCLAEVNKSDASEAARAQILESYPVSHHPSMSTTSETSNSS